MWRDRRFWLVVATLSLGAAIQVRDGLFSPAAIALLAAAIASIAISIFRDNTGGRLDWVMCVALLVQFALLIETFPGGARERHPRLDYTSFGFLIGISALLLGLMWNWNWRLFIAAMSLAYVVAAVWILTTTPAPTMDVFVFQRDACEAILAGKNPYGITFPDVYGPSGAWVYAPGLAHDGQLNFGFPYMPLTLAWDLIGHVFAPDYRYAQAIAVVIAAFCIAAIGRSRTSVLAALLLLFTPRGFFIIEQGWTEPLSVMLFAAMVFSAARRWRVTPILFGLLIASKQYCLLSIPLVLLLLPPTNRSRWIAIAAATTAIVTLPLVLWNVKAFWSNAVVLQFLQPFREDSLSFAALVARITGIQFVWFVPLLFVMISVVVHPRKFRDFAFANASVYLMFLAFNKQAFANYYFFVIAILCCAIALPSKTHAAT